ncbi:MAG: hypothetical protein KIT84_43680 [Labilithrix sp.]|nr:hypothetical protein [Labilithrix sp.]MCW5817981.1 hypothetical protein [Labilithrix sp.]
MLAFTASCKGGRPRPESAPLPNDDAATPAPAPLTYWGAVAPILESHCTSCHAEGGIGPIALTSFADAKTHAGDIAYQTRTKHMPPWLPDTKACAPLGHSRALADADVTTLVAWAEAGAPEGDRAEYRAPKVTKTYATLPAEPDRVVTPAEGYVPKRDRNDDYHCFVLDPKLVEPERVVGLRIAPGLPSVVHHVLLYEVRARAVERIQKLDAAEPGPGYTCFGGIGVVPTVRAGNLAKGELVDFDAQMIVGWAPGAGATDEAGAPTKLPEGTAIQLAPGSRLVMQVHYSLENYAREKTRADRTRIDMWLAKRGEPLKQAVWIPLLDWNFRVPKDAPATDPRATAHAEFPLPLSLEVLGVAPHMHLRGKSIRVESTGDGAESTCLLDVPRWDFHHQEGYWLTEGVRVGKAALTCRWDNSPGAQPIVNGKRKPSRELRWGEGTDDEMCLAFLYATL